MYQLDEHNRLLANVILGAYIFQGLYNMHKEKLGPIAILSLKEDLRVEGNQVK